MVEQGREDHNPSLPQACVAPGVSLQGSPLYLSHLESNEEEQVDLQAPWPEHQDNEERRPRCPPSLKVELASYVHWHTAYQMSINHVALRGLVNLDKRVELLRLANSNGDAQESIITSVQETLTKHRVDHLCLWQGMFQNNNGSWKGFYSNGKGCERHKGTATRWLGCPAAHLRFHLLKRGVTNDSALNLIRRSFMPQAFWDALQATFRDGVFLLPMLQ
jgi:hypothetical protein